MSRLTDQLLSRLPQVRESFYASGFDLPCQYLAAIEATRQRGADEVNYEHYLDEVVREYAAMPLPWQPSLRHLLQPDERSAYLEMLATRFGSESASLDPSYQLFAKLDEKTWLDLLRRFRLQKQIEAERHALEFEALTVRDSHALTDGIVRIAAGFGFYPNRFSRSRDRALDLESRTDRTLPLSLRLIDPQALQRRGDVVLQYVFDELPGKPFGLSSFVPGDGQYSHWNKTPQSVLFSFYVQCRFAAELSATGS